MHIYTIFTNTVTLLLHGLKNNFPYWQEISIAEQVGKGIQIIGAFEIGL